ncbi:hypothetical protein Pla22_23520 [Rubripirellula amarantea]|uniref:Uncharacterized protein n=1 Tax=Rubripirellula amarantea TaxID=2527999 RepID=A0A5C5WX72_9BACT|nr:hypothetical protein [Rubripirellula amarantea]TWT54701.1 hypothetical protein Pla22_23520 [Rubripirellula amarantea]
MTESSSHDTDSAGKTKSPSQWSHRNKSKLGGIAVVLLVGLYSFAAPKVNERMGWNLPALKTDAAGNVRLADKTKQPEPTRATNAKTSTDVASRQKTASSSTDSSNSGTATSGAATSGTATSGTATSGTATSGTATSGTATSGTPLSDAAPTESPAAKASAGDSSAANGDLRYGLLREVSRDRFLSPEGLLYTPGSAEGHRLDHLARHTRDQPNRPGSHGVFDGEMEGALKTIDRAYARAKTGQRTTKSVDQGRTIYTVDMGGRVGFVGGQVGKRKRNPMARRVRLVLDGDRVITAYPM